MYASPNATIKNQIWVKLTEMVIVEPWPVIDNFKCVIKGEEISSSKGTLGSFAVWIEQRGLIGLGFTGHMFTWNYGICMETRRVPRLDRGLYDDSWSHQFPTSDIKHLAHEYSDHYPLLLWLQTAALPRLEARPFRFQATWVLHK